jgi:hypothetical protein
MLTYAADNTGDLHEQPEGAPRGGGVVSQHTSAYVRIRQHTLTPACPYHASARRRRGQSAYAYSIRQHKSAYAYSIRQRMLTDLVSIRIQHTSA